MEKQYSIAEARNHLPRIIHEVESGSPVELTRRGKVVAVILSVRDYRPAQAPKRDFWDAYQEWRRSVDLEELDLGPEYFEGLRDKSPGRDFHW
jgi:prevent-host-death family protein